MIGAANVNGKVANKKELQGYVTVPNKILIEDDSKAKQAIKDTLKDCVEGNFSKYLIKISERPYGDASDKKITTWEFNNEDITKIKDSTFAYYNGFLDIGENDYAFNEVNVKMQNCLKIGEQAFFRNSCLHEIYFPKVKEIGGNAFVNTFMKRIDLPDCIKIDNYVFQNCFRVEEINLPKVKELGDGVFQDTGLMSSLSNISLPSMTYFNTSCFNGSVFQNALFSNENITQMGGNYYFYAPFMDGKKIKRIIIPKCTTVPKLGSVDGLVGNNATLKAQVTIYVPRAMVEQYKAATNWSAFNIAAIEDNRAELQGIFTELDELEGWS